MKQLFLSILILSTLSVHIEAQVTIRDCGTPSPTTPIFIDAETLSRTQVTFPILVKIFIHVIADDDGSNVAAGDSSINRQLENMRQFYAPQNICFVLAGKQQINNTDLNSMDVKTERAELNPYLIPDMINIFVHTSLVDGSALLNGNSYAISNWYLSIVRSAMISTTNLSTMPHELGHDFGLYHTHETFEGTKRENVPRSGNCTNCSDNGDLLCDTQADPDLDSNNSVDANCNYTGMFRDACNNLYTPDTRNLMAYGNRDCRNIFTNGQGQRARAIIQNTMSNIIALDDYAVTTNATLISGRQFLLARNTVTINTLQYTVTGSAMVDVSAAVVDLKPGVRLQPGNGYVKIRANALCQ